MESPSVTDTTQRPAKPEPLMREKTASFVWRFHAHGGAVVHAYGSEAQAKAKAMTNALRSIAVTTSHAGL
jgi:hypothetical protein